MQQPSPTCTNAHSGFSWRGFLAYNGLTVLGLTIISALLDLGGLPLRVAIYALISLTISGIIELGVPLVDRWTEGGSARRQLLLLNGLYLVGGSVGMAIAFGAAHLAFGIRLPDGRVLSAPYIAVSGLVAAFVGNLVHTYEHLRDRVRRSESALARQAVERARLEKLRAEAELSALQARINPHFLFNTLNSLAALIPVDPAAAEEMTQRLSECFRYILRASHGPVTLADEIAFVEDYLALEKLRFGQRLAVELELDAAAAAVRVPGLVVQPLVENALKHGLGPLERGGTVRIHVRPQNGWVIVRVADDGLGPPSGSTDPGGGTGLANVRGRLRSAFGEAADVELARGVAGGAVTTLRVPVNSAPTSIGSA